MTRSKIRVLLFVAACLTGALIYAFSLKSSIDKATRVQDQESMGPIGMDYTLTDQNGDAFKRSDLTGKYQLLYFGFTFCPDICPVEFTKMTEALKQLGDKADKVVPVMISIDPVRDTPNVLKVYLASYDPRFVGLTGTEQQIDEVVASYKAYAKRIEDEKYSDYMMDHSSFIYLIGPDQDLLKLYTKGDSAADIAADLDARID